MKKCTIITDGRGAVECPEEQYSDALINAMGVHPIKEQEEGPNGGFLLLDGSDHRGYANPLPFGGE